MKTRLLIFSTLATLVAVASASAQTRIRVDFNHNAPTAFSALGAVFHDGSFDSFELGQNRSGTGLETLAEVGNAQPFIDSAPASADVGTNGGPTGQGVSSSFEVDVDSSNTQFNFASMVLFSNDWFVGNATGESVDLTSLLAGAVGDSFVIDLDAVYDLGTEVEDFTGVGGSGFFPFSTSGALGTDITDGAVTLVDRSTNPFSAFTNDDNLDLAGFDIASLDGFTAASLGNITLTVVSSVPEPSSALFGIFGCAMMMCRRKKK